MNKQLHEILLEKYQQGYQEGWEKGYKQAYQDAIKVLQETDLKEVNK